MAGCMNHDEITALHSSHILPTYARQDVSFVRGEGVYLYDTDEKRYLDFASGIGVNSIGHAHPRWVASVAGQAGTLSHTSNLYYTHPSALLAEKLCAISGLNAVFFSNSGAEANEGLIKLARKYSADKYGDPKRHTIVTLNQSFHGRTHTTLAATGQDVFHRYFQPLTEGFIHVNKNSVSELEALGDDVCAVLVELVQGEGGVLPLDREYVKKLRDICTERDWLLMIDEVQTGIGRCGKWFASELYGIKPDALSFAKGVAGGLPLGGFITGGKALGVLTKGLHGSTFGGNPVCCAAALETLSILEDYLPAVSSKGKRVMEEILSWSLPAVRGVRGEGLMIGISVEGTPADYVKTLLGKGLVCLTAGQDAIRLLPPLVINDSEIDEGLEIFKSVLSGGIS